MDDRCGSQVIDSEKRTCLHPTPIHLPRFSRSFPLLSVPPACMAWRRGRKERETRKEKIVKEKVTPPAFRVSGFLFEVYLPSFLVCRLVLSMRDPAPDGRVRINS